MLISFMQRTIQQKANQMPRWKKLPNGPDVKSYLRGNLGLGFFCLHIDY